MALLRGAWAGRRYCPVADGYHSVSLILSYHTWSFITGRNLSLFNYEKEGEFVPVKGI